MSRHPEVMSTRVTHTLAMRALIACLTLASTAASVHAAVIGGAQTPSSSSPATGAASQATPSPRFHLRCWQDGRLIFEQAVATLPAEAGRSTRIQAKDAAREPVIVYETRNATCMARALRTTR
jgi:hypothetical protein